MSFDYCPLCSYPVGLGSIWSHSVTGLGYGTCFKMNRPEHYGRQHHFRLDNGEPLQVQGGLHASMLRLMQLGQPIKRKLRGFSGDFLSEKCGIRLITRNDIGDAFPENNALWLWADSVQVVHHCLITMLAIQREAQVVGFQLRAFSIKHGDGRITGDSVRTLGSADGLYIPPYTGVLPSALVLHEGAWGAIAAQADAWDYQSHEIFSVAALSANVKAETIKSTLDLIFPGVPRFSIFDQDPAGIGLRKNTLRIAKPITINGAGPGKDYRELIPSYRFERLSEIIRAELKLLDGRS